MNIYINTTNLNSLSKESNKSGLINRLLAEHYGHEHSHKATPVKKPVIKELQAKIDKVISPKTTPEITYKPTNNWGA